MKPYLISKGIKPDDVAIYVGIYGSAIGFLGGILTSIIARKFSKKTLLTTFMLFNMVSASILILIESYGLTLNYILVAVTLTALAIALSSAIVFSMIMDYSRDKSRAVDYSTQASLFAMTRIFSAVIAGILVSSFGFGGMFIFELTGMIFVLFIIMKLYK